jgi:hypothetical protein
MLDRIAEKPAEGKKYERLSLGKVDDQSFLADADTVR